MIAAATQAAVVIVVTIAAVMVGTVPTVAAAYGVAVMAEHRGTHNIQFEIPNYPETNLYRSVLL